MGAIGNKIKGKLKEVEGRVTGDKLREGEGRAQKAAGTVGMKVKEGVAKMKAKAKVAKAKVAAKVMKTKAGRKAVAARYTP